MGKIAVGVALRDRLGDDGARALSDFVEQHSDVWRVEVVNTCTEHLDGRFHEYARRSEVIEGLERVTNMLATKTELADVKVELADKLADMRVEILRWSFLFWIGQVAALFGAMAMLAQWIRP